ncbi:MAG: 5'-methylthioadenosine/adenosylhomocysteine nucleosidase [Ruminococcaceae bacterium]|nr:5'-methylthioadenosine/adenosylhomocysteine nucleosidase [Oscillospiraceae bacterium]
MFNRTDIGIIGAMEPEIETLIANLTSHKTSSVGGITFHRGRLGKVRVVIAKCGIGKVFAALCAEAMIIKYAPKLIINTGVGGGIAKGIKVGDVLIADKLVQHDMDTSAIGDPKGLVSGINKIYFDADKKAIALIKEIADERLFQYHVGTVASGDLFVSDAATKERIREEFSASVCEMEGAAIAHVCYVNNTPCTVIRAVSDSADEDSSMDYQKFLPIAAKKSALITIELCKKYFSEQ